MRRGQAQYQPPGVTGTAARAGRRQEGGSLPQLPAAQLLDRIVEHIHDNLARRITVNELARIARLSEFQLIRAFRRRYTVTPYAFVLRLRIEYAKSLLGTGATIADAAIDAGFSDQSHLTRHFKRLEGTTPRRFSQRWTGTAVP